MYLIGETACGKSTVGVLLAGRLGAEIVALDSMTLYRGMDIGTAKPTHAERGGVPHHMIDILDPWESASVAQYRARALEVTADIEARGRSALFVGGTALYLKALLRGIFEGPSADPAIRSRLEREAVELGSQALHDRLNRLDPRTAARLHPNDRRRIVRALEVHELTGTPLSGLQVEHDRPAPDTTLVFAIQRPRPELYDRINRRVDAMFEAGLIDEVRTLQAGPRPLHPVPAQGVGYREVIEHLAGGLDLAATIDRVQTRTRQFAKRQGTWFRNLSEVRPLPVAAGVEPGRIAEELARAIDDARRR